MSLLKIEGCTISYKDQIPAVSDVSLSVEEREIISIVGESGSGKTTLIRGILGLLPPGGKMKSGQILFQGRDLARLEEEQLRKLRGIEMAMIFQDAGASLDPIRTIGSQYRESMRAHGRKSREEYRKIQLEMLASMQLTDPERVLDSYPFELSGGMKQRVGIAMAMTGSPRLLLADEPTSALDVTIQAQVVQQIKNLRETYNTAVILVTHNMGVASYLSDKIGVMRKGKLVEFASRDEIIYHPQHEYTKELLAAVPKLEGPRFAK